MLFITITNKNVQNKMFRLVCGQKGDSRSGPWEVYMKLGEA
jgi:hypothetical protein